MVSSRGERRRAGCITAVMFSLWLFAPAGVSAQTFGNSAVVTRAGNPTLLVDGRPFFFYGAAFFYERIPAARWRASMLALRTLGFNTLDLYVPWNWHELSDGEFDFDGHTNARRNLRGVLALARELNFKLIVRPGPVIRNEWRNGGYPAWLLTRPAYGMPLHDVLEGRYPATATLQNANSDDAAAQWLNNATHLHYASRWLRTALAEFTPFADRVIAVQLDDDQGAYIDNQTWPAPHLQTYLKTLQTIVRGVVGPQLPLFINTYEMKVTASAPVWAMGNWYQSDAYAIGEHDRAALEFSTGLLQTQTQYPIAISEFQAGWLAPPEDPAPRPADPTNTTLALHTLLGLGARGVTDFPPQDTINPAGWEAPFANAAYAWDAALDVNLVPSERYAPTAAFGDLIRVYGPQLAAARRYADGAIAYLTSAYDESHQTNADVFAIVARTQETQHACRARHLTCDLVDLRFISDELLRRYPFVIVPGGAGPPMVSLARDRLARYRSRGGRILANPPDVVVPTNGGIPDATVLLGGGATAFLDVVNYETVPRTIGETRIHLPGARVWVVGPFVVPARGAVLLRYDPAARQSPKAAGSQPRAGAPPLATQPVPIAEATPLSCLTAPPLRRHGPPFVVPQLIEDDRASDGYPRVTLANDLVSVTLSPNAGARSFAFFASPDRCLAKNFFTSVGALRDDVAVQLPLSITDRIGKYTRSFPAGMFNRPYAIERRSSTADEASVALTYDAPDVAPDGARFERTVRIDAGDPGFTVTESATFEAGSGAQAQRAVRYDSFDSGGAAILDERGRGAIGFFYPTLGMLASVSWPASDVEDARIVSEPTSTVIRLQFAPGGERRTRYALSAVVSLDDARASLLKERDYLAAKR